MPSNSDSVTIQLELPRDEYKRVEEQARKEHRSVSEVIPGLVSSELRRREAARQSLAEASESYRARLSAAGELDMTPDEIFAELRALREEVANELFPA
jgi:hypothetical protein